MPAISKRSLFALIAVGCVAFSIYGIWDKIFPLVQAPHNVSEGNVMLKGHDPVAYFKESEAVKGKPKHSLEHDGVVYNFSSAENMSDFQAEPEKYAPAYGGYCAYGVRLGMKFDIDPAVFEIVDGTLYLQLDPGTQSVWREERDKNIEIADQEWKRIEPLAPESLSTPKPKNNAG